MYLLLQTVFYKVKTKSQSSWHLQKQRLYKLYIVYEDEIETHNRQKPQKTQKDKIQKNR